MITGLLIITLSIVLLVDCQTVKSIFDKEAHVFEFGYDFGEPVYETAGEIGLLSFKNVIPLLMPKSTKPSYVRVQVNGISSPNVSYDIDSRNVSIQYIFPQITSSTYDIKVKGRTCVPDQTGYVDDVTCY